MHENIREFIALAREAQRICDSDADWETKYDLIFSNQISLRVFALVDLDYYDPDTSEEEDVLAFCRAATERADEYEKALR